MNTSKSRLALFLLPLVPCGVAFGQGDALSEIRLKGRIGETLDRMIERHVVATDVDYITALMIVPA